MGRPELQVLAAVLALALGLPQPDSSQGLGLDQPASFHEGLGLGLSPILQGIGVDWGVAFTQVL